jgi:hypothetical protein
MRLVYSPQACLLGFSMAQRGSLLFLPSIQLSKVCWVLEEARQYVLPQRDEQQNWYWEQDAARTGKHGKK